ncbi:helix-turn-helix domain-containing protein [Mycobacterium sp. NPDC048908]|uniref:helix-turn-helix domain-containing protein n=1 Tax=Mycobacterium sp. NPDC048908 TaxID=3364292 RepID=UPI0037219B5B
MTAPDTNRPEAWAGSRSVIETAFGLLDLIAELQPVRLVDLSVASALPHPTVHRLLQQLVTVGAVRRERSRYALGASLLRLGATVTPAARLRIACRRPMAELASITGAAVSLSADLGDGPIYLDALAARSPVRFLAKAGGAVPGETAQGRAHHTLNRPVVDAGEVAPDYSCVAMGIPYGSATGVAVVSTLIPSSRPSDVMLAATRRTAERIAGVMLMNPL